MSTKKAIVELSNGNLKKADIPADKKVGDEVFFPVKGEEDKFIKVVVVTILSEEKPDDAPKNPKPAKKPTPAPVTKKSDKDDDGDEEKTPYYKKVRFWVYGVIALFIIVGIVRYAMEKPTTTNPGNGNPTPTINKQQDNPLPAPVNYGKPKGN